MSVPLPMTLRFRFHRLIEEGFSGGGAALPLQLFPAISARWATAIRRTGEAWIAPQGHPKGNGKLDPHRGFLVEVLEEDGDLTMAELSAALHEGTGVRTHPNAVMFA